MKNAAGDYRCNEYIPGELVYAGITPIHHIIQLKGEVPTHFTGELHEWTFRRAWYYWVATGPPLPLKYASPFHKLIGDEVRVHGHCDCPSPEEWCGEDGVHKGDGSVKLYHIDTQRGLMMLSAVIQKWHSEEKVE